jgi:hypothetical protein
MKKVILLLLVLVSINAIAASKLEKAFRALQENNYPEAKIHFDEILSKNANDAGANYGLSLYYYKLMTTSSNKDPNFLPSWNALMSAYKNFDQTDKKELELYTKLDITKENLFKQKETLEGISFEVVKNSTNSDIALGFMSVYKMEPLTTYYNQSKEIFEKNMFFEMDKQKEMPAYKYYIDHFPNSKYLPMALRGYDSVQFVSYKKKNNADSITAFINKYPNNQFIKEAKEYYDYQLYADYTKDNIISNYEKYIKDYPNSLYVPFAKKNIKQFEAIKDDIFLTSGGFPSQTNFIYFGLFNLSVTKVSYIKEKNDIKTSTKTYDCSILNNDRKEVGASGSTEIFKKRNNKFIIMNGNDRFTMIQTRLSSYQGEVYYFIENYTLDSLKDEVKPKPGVDLNYQATLNKQSSVKYSANTILAPHSVNKNDIDEREYTLKSAIRLKNKNLCLMFSIGTNYNRKIPLISGVHGFAEFEPNEYDKLNNFFSYYKIIVLSEDGKRIINQKFFLGSFLMIYPANDGGFYVLQDKATLITSISDIFSNINYPTPGVYMMDKDFPLSPDGVNLLKFDSKIEWELSSNYYTQTDKTLKKDIVQSIIEDDNGIYLHTYSFKNGIINYPSLCIYKIHKDNISAFNTYVLTDDYVFDKDYKYSIYNPLNKLPDQIVSLNNTLYLKYNSINRHIAKMELKDKMIVLSPK